MGKGVATSASEAERLFWSCRSQTRKDTRGSEAPFLQGLSFLPRDFSPQLQTTSYSKASVALFPSK